MVCLSLELCAFSKRKSRAADEGRMEKSAASWVMFCPGEGLIAIVVLVFLKVSQVSRHKSRYALIELARKLSHLTRQSLSPPPTFSPLPYYRPPTQIIASSTLVLLLGWRFRCVGREHAHPASKTVITRAPCAASHDAVTT